MSETSHSAAGASSISKRDLSAGEHFVSKLMNGEVVVNIGHVDDASKRQLDKLVRSGVAIKWRGKWFPVAGAAFGLGPDKTCWGLKAKFATGA